MWPPLFVGAVLIVRILLLKVCIMLGCRTFQTRFEVEGEGLLRVYMWPQRRLRRLHDVATSHNKLSGPEAAK